MSQAPKNQNQKTPVQYVTITDDEAGQRIAQTQKGRPTARHFDSDCLVWDALGRRGNDIPEAVDVCHGVGADRKLTPLEVRIQSVQTKTDRKHEIT